MRPRSLFPALLLGLLAFLAYRLTTAPAVLPGDAGEFQFTVPLAGLSHPTGYPLYHVLGWTWGWLYRANPAQGVNEFSALWGAIAVALFYLLAHEVLSRLLTRLHWQRGAVPIAALAAIVFASNPTFWSQATQAEVYTMHAALVAALLGATVATGRISARPGSRWLGKGPVAWPVALLFGLGLAHHLTIILFAPGVLLYLYLVRPDTFRPGNVLRLLPFLLLPLLLYLYVPLRAGASPWLRVELAPGQTLNLFDGSFGGVLRFILGVRFAPELRAPSAAFNQIPVAAQLFLTHFGWVGLALMVVGVLAMILEDQLPVLALTGVSLLLVVVFNLFYGIQDIEAFYIPAYVIAILWLGLGLAYLVELVMRVTGMSARPYLLVLTFAILVLPYLTFRAYRPQFDRSTAYATQLRWQEILHQELPGNAVLVSNDRDEITPMLYLKHVGGFVPGMTGLFPLLSSDPAWTDLNTTLAAAVATGRPVYTIKPMPGIEARYQTQPLTNGLVQVLGPQPAPDPSYEAPYGDDLRWLNVAWTGDAQPGGVLEVDLFWRVVQQPSVPWHSFLQLVDGRGGKVAQADDHRPGGDYLPATLWHSGDVVSDRFSLSLPSDLSSGDYTLVAGFYDPVSGARMADPLTVALVRLP